VTSPQENDAPSESPAPENPGASAYRQRRFERPPGATELLLIRHGESQAADPDIPFPLAGGHADPALHPNGREQSLAIAERLGGSAIDAIYVTTLQRTAQTAAPLAARLGLTPQVEPDLREVFLGDWEAGLFRKMVAEQHPIAQQMWEEERWDVIPGAEPAPEFAARVGGAITRIAAAHPDQVVAAFVHGGVVGQALALASGSRPFAFLGADNGSISRLVITPQRWIVRGFNDVAHLPEPPARR
jgi:2,3-bisphosphoglycerate-dependent phosphoglycerate mutase